MPAKKYSVEQIARLEQRYLSLRWGLHEGLRGAFEGGERVACGAGGLPRQPPSAA